jgi:hypothetical protein
MLAALDEYNELALEMEALAEARAHLAGCARCQARRRTWARLDGALRASLAPTAATPALTTADLLAAIGADHEPRERRLPMLSVIALRNEDDMDEETQMPAAETSQSAPVDDASSATLAANDIVRPAFPPLPELKPARPQSPWRRALTGLVAVASVAALVAGVTGALNLTGRLHGAHATNRTLSASATQTTLANQTAQAGVSSNYQIVALSMDSPGDGWAVAVNEFGGSPSSTILHIDHGVMVKQVVLPDSVFGATALRAFSTTNVWLMLNNLYHYDGQSWTKVSLPLPADAEPGTVLSLQAFTMLTPVAGWAIASYILAENSPNPPTLFAFYRYDGSTWHRDAADSAATASAVANLPDSGQTSSNGAQLYQISGISALPGGDVWATGFVLFSDPNIAYTTYKSTIYHRTSGVWHIMRTVKDVEYTGIAMVSPSLGWIAGEQTQVTRVNAPVAPYTITNQIPMALVWDGTRWSPAGVPQPSQTQVSAQFGSVVASGPANAWIVGLPNSSSFTASGQYVSDNTYLAHFDGARWSSVAPPRIAVVSPGASAALNEQASFQFAATLPSGDLWLAGGVTIDSQQGYIFMPLLYHYAGGVWTNIPIPNLG